MYQLCRHLLASGRRCTQPAVTGTLYCRHHRVVKRTIAESVLSPQLHSLHKAIPFLYPEDRAAITANVFLIIRALDDRRINTQTANAMNRLLRTCQANLKRGPLHESDNEPKSKPSLNSKAQKPSVPNHTGAPEPVLNLPNGQEQTSNQNSDREPSDPSIVHRVILTSSGEEIAPAHEIWEQGEQQLHGAQCPCSRCAEQYRAAKPEQHRHDCRCGDCPQLIPTASGQDSSPAEPPSENYQALAGAGAWDENPTQETDDGPFQYTCAESEEEREKESQCRSEIMEKHKDRFHKLETRYLGSPDLADRINATIQEIMEQELGPEAFSYPLPPSAA